MSTRRWARRPPLLLAWLITFWTLRELVGLLEEAESVPTKRGRYTKTRERRQREREIST